MVNARIPGQRAGLTRSAVVACAREVLAEQGPQALSMRALAGRLGVAPNALYSHVENKTELIDAVLDEALSEIESPSPDASDPLTGLEAIMRSTWRVLLANPGLVPLYVSRQGARGPNARRLGERMLDLLERAGMANEDALAARRVLIVHTIGFAALASRAPLEAERPIPPGELTGSFERGLGWLLAGIAAR